MILPTLSYRNAWGENILSLFYIKKEGEIQNILYVDVIEFIRLKILWLYAIMLTV